MFVYLFCFVVVSCLFFHLFPFAVFFKYFVIKTFTNFGNVSESIQNFRLGLRIGKQGKSESWVSHSVGEQERLGILGKLSWQGKRKPLKIRGWCVQPNLTQIS